MSYSEETVAEKLKKKTMYGHTSKSCRTLGPCLRGVSNGKTMFARRRDKMEAQPLDFAYFRDVGNLDISLDLNFNIKELDASLWRGRNTSPGSANISYEMLQRFGAGFGWILILERKFASLVVVLAW